MAEIAKPTAPGAKSKERSPNYPNYTLTETIELAKKLYAKEKRTPVPADVVAKAIGYGGLSGASRSAIAALRQWGLVEDGPAGMRVSEAAMQILHLPETVPERIAAIQAAAMRPALIAELAATHADASDDALRGYLVVNRKFSADGAGRFIEAFRDALMLSGPPAEGYLASDGDKKQDTLAPPPGGKTVPRTPPPKGDRIEFSWPLSDDLIATVSFSRQPATADIAQLKDYLDVAEKALKRKLSQVASAVAGTEASGSGIEA